jgi:hypothetical protein
MPVLSSVFSQVIDAAAWPVRQDAAAVTDQSVAFVEAQELGDRWLLWAHYTDAGNPFMAAAVDRADVGDSHRPWPVDAWRASMVGVDREVARLLQALPSTAIVVLVGSQGLQLDEDRPARDDMPVSAVDGHSLYQEVVHVPMSIAGPGIPAGRHGRPASHVDVVPTLLDLLDLAEARSVNGTALAEVAGRKGDDVPVLTMAMRWGAGQQSARVGKDKLIHEGVERNPLFDLDDDPHELLGRYANGPNEQAERLLLMSLPPMNAGTALLNRPGPSQRLGVWARTTLERRPISSGD